MFAIILGGAIVGLCCVARALTSTSVFAIDALAFAFVESTARVNGNGDGGGILGGTFRWSFVRCFFVGRTTDDRACNHATECGGGQFVKITTR